MYKLCSERKHLRNFLHQIIGQFISETHSFAHMFIQIDRSLSTPGSLVFFQLDFVILLCIFAGCLSTDLHCGIWRSLSITDRSLLWTIFIPDLQKSRSLITFHSHSIIVIYRIIVDFLPGMICILRYISSRNSQIHCHHTGLIIIFV